MKAKFHPNNVTKLTFWLLISVLSFQSVAQQQQNSNGYTYWAFDSSANNIINIEQEVWIPKIQVGTQWVMLWDWSQDPSSGGYLGFNNDENGKSQILFSIWKATEAIAGVGFTCVDFDGEGVGKSCRKEFTIKNNRFYRFSLTQSKVDTVKKGVWWRASIFEESWDDINHKPIIIEHNIGAIMAPEDMTYIKYDSVGNFIEYYGDAVSKCVEVPASMMYASAPYANKNDSTQKYKYKSFFRKFNWPHKCDSNQNSNTEGAKFSATQFKIIPQYWAKLYSKDPPSDSGSFLILGGDGSPVEIGKKLLKYADGIPPTVILIPGPE